MQMRAPAAESRSPAAYDMPDASGHFLVLSAGADSAGAYTYEGAQLPCPAAGFQ